MPKEGGDGMEDGPERVHARHGVWCKQHHSKSSNNRELRNLVEVAEEELKAGRMEGVELLCLTNNSVAEAVYYRGKSSNKEIFELMLRLVYLEMRGCFRLHIIWVIGKSQIAAGIDGFQGYFGTDGISSSGSILDFVPLNKTAFERSVSLLPWVRTWIGVNNIEPLTCEGWFEEGNGFKGGKKNGDCIWMPYHSKGTFLWSPTLSVVDLVSSQLGEAVKKCPNSLHVFIFPKLMIPVWGRRLFKMDDLVVYGLPGATFVHPKCTSRLFLVFISPLIPHVPWRLRGTPKVMVLGRTVYFLLLESPGDAWSVLRQHWLPPKRVASTSGVLEQGLFLS